MQIHELTTKSNLDEGVLDTVKSVAGRVGTGLKQGALATAYNWGIGSGVKGGAQDLTNKVVPLWNQTIAMIQKRTPGQPINDRVYETELENFINKVFFKNRLGTYPTVMQQKIADAVRQITQSKDNPTELTTKFGNLIKSLGSTGVSEPGAQINIPAGHRYAVSYQPPGQTSPAFYYRNAQGWSNSEGQAISDPGSIEFLNRQIPISGRLEKEPLAFDTYNPRKSSRKRSR